MSKNGLGIGVIGGLGLLLGSEFSVRYITIFGAALILICIIFMIILAYKGRE